MQSAAAGALAAAVWLIAGLVLPWRCSSSSYCSPAGAHPASPCHSSKRSVQLQGCLAEQQLSFKPGLVELADE